MVGKIYSSTSKAYLAKLKDLVAHQDSLQAFIARNKIKQETGTLEKNERAVLSGIDWTPGAHLSSNNGMQYLVVIEKILPPGPESFEEARAAVISDYQTWLEKTWLSELKRKFGVKVEKKARKRAFAELMKS
jgi:peptidyl-prolyl cis-trans isomerase SurA